METFKVRWCPADGNWHVVDDATGEIHGQALRHESLWLAVVPHTTECLFWSEKNARDRVEQELALTSHATYEFAKD